MKLYLVTTQKTFGKYVNFYVVADNPDQAYNGVRLFLDEHDLCFRKEREMDSVKLIADEQKYGSIETILLIKPTDTP